MICSIIFNRVGRTEGKRGSAGAWPGEQCAAFLSVLA